MPRYVAVAATRMRACISITRVRRAVVWCHRKQPETMWAGAPVRCVVFQQNVLLCSEEKNCRAEPHVRVLPHGEVSKQGDAELLQGLCGAYPAQLHASHTVSSFM